MPDRQHAPRLPPLWMAGVCIATVTCLGGAVVVVGAYDRFGYLDPPPACSPDVCPAYGLSAVTWTIGAVLLGAVAGFSLALLHRVVGDFRGTPGRITRDRPWTVAIAMGLAYVCALGAVVAALLADGPTWSAVS